MAMISLALLVACNSIVGFDDLTKQPRKPDAGAGPSPDDDDITGDDDDDDKPRDGGVDAGPRCDRTKPFGPAAVLEVGTDQVAETKRAILTRDELELFYLRGTSAPFELRHATRADREAAWGEPRTEVLSPGASELGSLVLGGQKLYYFVVDTSGPSLVTSVFWASRKAGGAFSPGTKFNTIDRPVHVTEQDDSVYWAVNEVIDGAGNELIHRGNVVGNAMTGETTLTSTHFFPSLDDNPVASRNELILYFSSTRPGGLGASDIWRSTRASKSEDWGEAVNAGEVNSSTVDKPSWVSDDDCVLYLDKARHISIARRPL